MPGGVAANFFRAGYRVVVKAVEHQIFGQIRNRAPGDVDLAFGADAAEEHQRRDRLKGIEQVGILQEGATFGCRVQREARNHARRGAHRGGGEGLLPAF